MNRIRNSIVFIYTTILVLPHANLLFAQNHADSIVHLRLLFAGDIMQHIQQIDAARIGTGDSFEYDYSFRYIRPILALGDITIGNLETTFSGKPYVGWPRFSSPPQLAESIRWAGFNVLVTANNHTVDHSRYGLEQTIDVLRKNKLLHTGSFKTIAEREELCPAIIEHKGFKIALLNYTFSTNGLRVSQPNVVNLIDKQLIVKDLEKAKKAAPDFIVVYYHWGTEYNEQPNSTQRDLAAFSVEHGADLVMGSHPHFVQNIEEIETNEKKAWVVYSTGNFVSNYQRRLAQGGILFELILRKNLKLNNTAVEDVGIIPIYTYPKKVNDRTHYFVLPIAAVQEGQIGIDMDYDDYLEMMAYANHIRKKAGQQLDEVQYNLSDRVVENWEEAIYFNHPALKLKRWSLEEQEELEPKNLHELMATKSQPDLNKASAQMGYSTSKLAQLGISPPRPKKKPIRRFFAFKQKKEYKRLDQKRVEQQLAQLPDKNQDEPIISKTNFDQVSTDSLTTSIDSRLVSKVVPKVMDTAYKVQFYALFKVISIDTNYYTHLKGYEIAEEDGYLKYLLGDLHSYTEAKRLLARLKSKGHKDSFIVAYVDKKRVHSFVAD